MVDLSNVTVPTIVNASDIDTTTVVNTTKDVAGKGLDVVHGVAEGATGLIPAGFTFGFDTFIQLIIVHLIILFIFHRTLGIFKSVILAAVASALIPIVLVKFLGFGFALTLTTILTFVIFGVIAFLALAFIWKFTLGRGSSEKR